jgi:hypothetical protein
MVTGKTIATKQNEIVRQLAHDPPTPSSSLHAHRMHSVRLFSTQLGLVDIQLASTTHPLEPLFEFHADRATSSQNFVRHRRSHKLADDLHRRLREIGNYAHESAAGRSR